MSARIHGWPPRVWSKAVRARRSARVTRALRRPNSRAPHGRTGELARMRAQRVPLRRPNLVVPRGRFDPGVNRALFNSGAQIPFPGARIHLKSLILAEIAR